MSEDWYVVQGTTITQVKDSEWWQLSPGEWHHCYLEKCAENARLKAEIIQMVYYINELERTAFMGVK